MSDGSWNTEKRKGKKRQFWGDYDELLVGETEQNADEEVSKADAAPANKRLKGDDDAENVSVI